MNIVCKNFYDFENPVNEEESKFLLLLKSKWDEIHGKPDVFRYKIDELKERIVNEKYLLQLNSNRATNRRTPELISNMSQPFSDEKFNFTKVSQGEVMFSVGTCTDDTELHSFIVNVSPISRYHTLFCPFLNKKLPQAITEESLYIAFEIMFIANDSNLKIGFNSLCGLASVNHLHFHLFLDVNVLPIEKAKRIFLQDNLFYLSDYPAPAFCFNVPADSKLKEVYKLIKYLQDNSIAHNVLMKLRKTLDVVEVYVFPRKSAFGVKQLTDFNVAVLELSGWFPVFSEEAFDNLKAEDLEKEMRNWNYDDFGKLCKEIPRIMYGRDLSK